MSFSNKKYNYAFFEIREREMKHIIKILESFEKVEKAVVYGSRAMGNSKKNADIEIAVFGNEIEQNIEDRMFGALNEEIPIPYIIDVLHYDSLESKELKEQIREQGKLIYEKQLTSTN